MDSETQMLLTHVHISVSWPVVTPPPIALSSLAIPVGIFKGGFFNCAALVSDFVIRSLLAYLEDLERGAVCYA